MREIKFRAYWHKTKLITLVDTIAFVNGGTHVSDGCTDMGWLWRDCEIMQYTGLTDKNGKEIYEGDIISFQNELTELSDKVTKVLEYVNGSFGFANCYEFKMFVPLKGLMKFHSVEVIGNIYENPDLLEA